MTMPPERKVAITIIAVTGAALIFVGLVAMIVHAMSTPAAC